MKPTALAAARARVQGPLLRAVLCLPDAAQRVLAGHPIERDGLRLDVGTQLMLRLERLAREPAITDLPVAAGRRAMDRQWSSRRRQPADR